MNTIPKIEDSVRSITELLGSIEKMNGKVTNIAATTEEISAQKRKYTIYEWGNSSGCRGYIGGWKYIWYL